MELLTIRRDLSLSLLSLLLLIFSCGLAKFNLFRVLKERSKTLNTKRNKETKWLWHFFFFTHAKKKKDEKSGERREFKQQSARGRWSR